uniref:Uncharacterized protein n=1 Tax=Latimeria chalumnae TaxID=7897 RepID=H2ZUB6_LATCH
MLNLVWFPKTRKADQSRAGFTDLEELCLATSIESFVSDDVILRILRSSTRLRTLDLRGCFRVSSTLLKQLPCEDLEHLYLGLYCESFNYNLLCDELKSEPITMKWGSTLRDLDITGRRCPQEDLERSMKRLVGSGRNQTLHSLSVACTKISQDTVCAILMGCPILRHLNLTSCRSLPRGWKKVHRGENEIQKLRNQIQDN